MTPPSGYGQEAPSFDHSALINHAYDYNFAFGLYEVADQDVSLLQLPISITLRSLEKYNWGLRLRLSAVFGIHNFKSNEDFDLDQIRSITIAPGIEFLIPTGKSSLLKPYLDVGIAKPEDGETIPISAAGVRWEYVLRWRQWELGIEPRIQYSLAKTDSREDDDDFGDLGLFLDARYPAPFQIGGYQPDAGIYYETGYLFNELSFTSLAGDPLKIDQQHEVGVSFGFRDRAKIWLFTLPRLGLGYRFGGGFKGFRIRIGGNRTLRIPD